MSDSLAVSTIIANTSMIKRPLIMAESEIYLGFNPEDYAQKLL